MSRATFPFVLTALAVAIPAQTKRWPYSMEYGPYLMTTLEGSPLGDFSNKAVVVRLGDRGGAAFDTELLRLSAAWTGGYLHLRGTAYDGAHGPMCRYRGRLVAESAPTPGWAAADGALGDPRHEPFGPLPKEWGRYRGLYLHGDRVVLSYQIGGMGVLEAHAIESVGSARAFVRQLELDPSDREQVMVVQDAPKDIGAGSAEWTGPGLGRNVASFAMLQWPAPAPQAVAIDAGQNGWSMAMGEPSAADYADRAAGNGVVVSWVPGFSVPHGHKAPAGADDAAALALPVLHDGEAAQNDDDWQRNVWFDKRKDGERERDDGRLLIDLKKTVAVSRVNTWSWHFGDRSVQDYELFASAAEQRPDAAAADPAAAGWTRVARVRTAPLGNGDRHGASVTGPAAALASCRWLLLHVRNGGCFLGEIDVWAGERQAPVDQAPASPQNLAVALIGGADAGRLSIEDGRMLLRIPAHGQPVRLALWHYTGGQDGLGAFGEGLARVAPAPELRPLTRGGPGRWGEPVATVGVRGPDDGPYAVDTLTVPFENRFGSRMRIGGLDFFTDGSAAVSTWNGDVWIVSGIDAELKDLRWRRFATGLFDPLGLRIVDGLVHVHGRDGLTRLHDLDGDGEADFYECFNNDVHVTKGFHEFAFDLQTDAVGNFYFSKGGPVNPGGRGFQRIADHHGTIMRVTPDGDRLDVIATGLRAPNGIGVGPNGEITSGDNEGTWMPRCRLNYFTRPGFYAGVRDTAHREPVPDQPDLPLCWMPMEIDNSGGGQVWVTSDRWGPLQGRLLHLSYGTCSAYLVLPQTVGDVIQGGVVRLPANFSSSCMRGRFHPVDGQLYVAGLQGWQTSAAKEGAVHRVRYTGQPLRLPVGLQTTDKGVYLTFAEPLDREVAEDVGSYGVEIWNYLYSSNYGSPELSVLHPERKREQGKENRDPLPIKAATLSTDGRTVFLAIPDIQPVMQMKVSYNLEDADGGRVRGELHNSIHRLPADQGMPGGGR